MNSLKLKKIPLVDLGAQYRLIKSEIDFVISEVLEHSAFIGGSFVSTFENEFSHAIGAKHVIGVGNGTDALFLVLKSLGVGSEDEVLVPANTFIATAEAVSATGAKPIFVDCTADDYCIDPSQTELLITPRTKAIIAVHLYGQPASMDQLVALAKKHNLFLIEDSAQAHFAEYRNKKIGTFGIASTFSFYPGKNLGAYGDAGAIVTNDDALAERCRMYANHGRKKGEKYDHQIEGYNSRLDAMQAAVLSVKLRHLSDWTVRRRAVATRYDSGLAGLPVVIPAVMPERKSAYHLYVIRIKERDALREYLRERNIESGVHYPIGLPFLAAYEQYKCTKKDFPNTAQYQDEILSLPMYAELEEQDQERIISAIADFYKMKGTV